MPAEPSYTLNSVTLGIRLSIVIRPLANRLQKFTVRGEGGKVPGK
jgi:hypothetical protein